MRITIDIEADDDSKKIPMVISNEEYDNYNFLAFTIGNKIYDISLDDLHHGINMFYGIRKGSNELSTEL